MLLVFSEREVRESLEMDRVANRQTFSSREIGRRRRNDEKFLHHISSFSSPACECGKWNMRKKRLKNFSFQLLQKKVSSGIMPSSVPE